MAYPFRLVWCGQFEWIRWCGQFEWIRWCGQFKWLKPKYVWFAHAADTGCTAMCCYSSYTSLLLSPLFLHLLNNSFFLHNRYFPLLHRHAWKHLHYPCGPTHCIPITLLLHLLLLLLLHYGYQFEASSYFLLP